MSIQHTDRSCDTEPPDAPTREATRYGLSLPHRVRAVLVAAAWDAETQPHRSDLWTHPALADALDTPDWITELWGAMCGWLKIFPPGPDTLRLNGTSAQFLTGSGEVKATRAYIDQDTSEPTLLAWALFLAAEGHMAVDPLILERTTTLLAQAADIPSLNWLYEQMTDLMPNIAQETPRE